MTAHLQEQKKALNRKVLIASYIGLTGLICFIYSFQTLNKWLDQPNNYFFTPGIVQWLYNKIGPMLSLSLSLLVSSLMITFGLYRLFTYRRQLNRLTRIPKEQVYGFKTMIDEE